MTVTKHNKKTGRREMYGDVRSGYVTRLILDELRGERLSTLGR